MSRTRGSPTRSLDTSQLWDAKQASRRPISLRTSKRRCGTAPDRCALFAILFHTFNGLRLLIVDLTDAGPRTVARALGIVVGLTLVLGVAGSIVILAPVLS